MLSFGFDLPSMAVRSASSVVNLITTALTDWPAANGAIVSEVANGTEIENGAAQAGAIRLAIPLEVSESHVLKVDIASTSGPTVRISLNSGGFSYNGDTVQADRGVGVHEFPFTPSVASPTLSFFINSTTVGDEVVIRSALIRRA